MLRFIVNLLSTVQEEFSRCLKRADALMRAAKENGFEGTFPVVSADKALSYRT